MALRVLLADDSVPAQNMGKKILTDAGYEVLTVGNGLEAMRKIKDIAPDIAILDIFMPGYSGLEVCRFLRADTKTAALPVILTVGKLEPYRPEDGENVQSNAVIVKPFGADELTTAVQTLAASVGGEAAAASAPAAEAEPQANTEAVLEQESQEEEALPEPEPTLPPVWEGGEEATAAAWRERDEEPEAASAASLSFDPDARQSRFQASVFDTTSEESTEKEAASQVNAYSGFALEHPGLDEFALPEQAAPELETADHIPEHEDAPRSWYAAEDTRYAADPLLETTFQVADEHEAESPSPYLEGQMELEEKGACAPSVDDPEADEPIFAMPSAAECEVLPELSTAENESAIEVIEIEAAAPAPQMEADAELEAAFDAALGSEHAEVSQVEVDEGEAEAPAPVEAAPSADAAPEAQDDEARRQAFEQLFNSDVPFPLQADSAPLAESEPLETHAQEASAEQAPIEAETSVEAGAEVEQASTEPVAEVSSPGEPEEVPVLEAQAPCGGCDTNEDEANSVATEAAEEEGDDEPLFYGNSLQTEAEVAESGKTAEPEEETVLEAAPQKSAPERMELVAEVAKVEALLAQMQAMRQAEPAAVTMRDEADFSEAESAPLSAASLNAAEPDATSVFAAEDEATEPFAEDADPLAEEKIMAAPPGDEVDIFLPPPESAKASSPEAAAPADGDAEQEIAEAMAAAAESGDSGRIQGAVEKVFERFRPLLVKAIARELSKRD